MPVPAVRPSDRTAARLRRRDAVGPRPVEAVEGSGGGPILATDPTGEAEIVYEIEQVRVVDLLRLVRLVPTGNAAHLEMRDDVDVGADRCRERALHDICMW